MRAHKRLRHGIFLITTLMLVAFLVMMASAIFVSVQGGFAMSGSLSNRELAKHAALNGLNFMQATLETNCSRLAPAPDGSGSTITINSSDGSMTVVQNGWNVAGWMSNSNVTGGGEQSVYLMFQACFNKSYTGYSAVTTAPVVNGIQLPPMPYVSLDNLLRPQGAAGLSSSYRSTGAAYQSVPGETADIIVMGYAISPDGRVLASRLAEGMFSIGQVGQYAPAGAVAQSDVNLQLISTTGQINVGVTGTTPNMFNGLASFAGNVNTIGLVDPITGATAPPVYNSTAKVSLNGSQQFNYTGPSGSAQYPGDTQLGAPAPPTVAPGSLPTLNSPVNVSAGTWVVWGSPAALYHYPMDYSSVGTSGGTPVPVQNLPWTQTAPTAAPLLNGVGPDQGPVTSLDATHQLTLTPSPGVGTAGNSITISANDVNVAPITVAGNPVNSFGLLVAPSETNTGVVIAGSAAANGSAQIIFQPTGSQSSIQFRDPGSITIMGNVTGAGSLQSTGTSSDVNVVGKSTLDPRADSGVALYATGNVNVWGAVDAAGNTLAQLPSSVGVYVPILQTNPQNTTGTSAPPPLSTPAASQLLTNMEYTAAGWPGSLVAGQTTSPTPGVGTAGDSYSGGIYTMNVDPAGSASSSQLVALLSAYNGGTTAATWCGGQCPDAFNAMKPAMDAINAGNLPLAKSLITQVMLGAGFTTSDGVNFTMSVTMADTVTTTGSTGTGSPTASPSTTASGSPLPSFDQSFNGLVYASNNFTANTNGSFTVNGGLISNAGKISVDSSNITLNYNSASIGQFAPLFGDRVTLHRNTVTVY